MILIITLVLALIFLPWPLSLVVIAIAAGCEATLAALGIRYARRRRAQVGVQTLIGRTAEVIAPLSPLGQVKIDGVIWEARGAGAAPVGALVRITRIAGLTLEVEQTGGSTDYPD
ncbi:MAG TPA: NfeD family protein [Solirubrobacteraceae bacterium]|jgi:membrane protein implicated in regulation of membrane protease activity